MSASLDVMPADDLQQGHGSGGSMRAGFVVVGAGLLVLAAVGGAVIAATASVAVGVACGTAAWKMGLGRHRPVARRV
jgi:hypothetical protein